MKYFAHSLQISSIELKSNGFGSEKKLEIGK